MHRPPQTAIQGLKARRKRTQFWVALLLSAMTIALFLLFIFPADPATHVHVSGTQGISVGTDERANNAYDKEVPFVATVPTSQTSDLKRSFTTLANGYTLVSHGEADTKTMSRAERHVLGVEMNDLPSWMASSNVQRVLTKLSEENGRGWMFAWIWMSRDMRRPAIETSLSEFGAEIVSESGHVLRVKLPTDEESVRRIADLAGVVRLAVMPVEAKLRGFNALPSEREGRTPVFVTLMEDDDEGAWRRELVALGADVGAYDFDLWVYSAHATANVIQALAQADFVLTVEPVLAVEPQLDTLIPAVGADALRTSIGPAVFSGVGGSSVPIGVMDTGLNIRHNDIVENRLSVCGANYFSTKARASDDDLWIDEDGHGTLVTGTIVGNGSGSVSFAGVAPSVQHVRFAKVLHERSGLTTESLRAMDYLALRSSCDGSVEVRPYIVNVSLGTHSSHFEGRDVGARKLDAIVWGHRQLYVVANANSGKAAFSNFGAAKNSLAVGATYDSGDIAVFSSHGPTADGRLAPHVVAPGIGVCGAKGNGAIAGYVCSSGTSFSAPAVAGMGALLMDALPDSRAQPALVRARLMASAIRPDAWLEAPSEFALDNSKGPGPLQTGYGLGKASARTLVLDRDAADGWIGGGATVEIADEDTYAYEDIQVPQDATRLDVVLTWDEPPVDPISESVLNDFDLWLDADADCADARCGEHASSSQIDNVEWVLVRNPVPGTWRLKVVGNRVHTESRAAIAWHVIRGASTPALKIDVATRSSQRTEIPSDTHFSVSASVDSYVAAGTTLHFECRGVPEDCDSLRIRATDITRENGHTVKAPVVVADMGIDHVPLGRRIAIGEVAAGETTTANVAVAYSGSTRVELYATLSAWNALGTSASLVIQPTGDSETNRAFDRPVNDDFDHATAIEGESGSIAIDLAGATPEPGEPPASVLEDLPDGLSVQRPLGSRWYRWEAPADGLTTFWLSSVDMVRSETLVVLEGSILAALEVTASNQWIERPLDLDQDRGTLRTGRAAAFFAKRDTSYFLRIANSERSPMPLTLHWRQSDGPVNDDFRTAMTLAGADGELYGTNVGATLEAGESLGSLAATTWYHWTAPRDGAWTFETDAVDLRVGVFTGEAVQNLRLVSGLPQNSVSFRAQSGQDYRIAVSTKNAYMAGTPYLIRWSATEWNPVEDDDFELRRPLTGASDRLDWEIGPLSTVEPGEPAETGVRTIWWKWTATATRDYTWRFQARSIPGLAMTVFEGGELSALQILTTTARSVSSREFSFSATVDTEYVFSVGWLAGDISAYTFERAKGYVSWGPTPQNDERTLAIALNGTRGITTADDKFATTALDELKDGLGHSSLWWTWEAPTSGWYMFRRQDRHVVIYRLDSGDLVPQGRFVAEATTFQAESGVKYLVRTSSSVSLEDSAPALDWAPTNAPAWLRYAGSVSTDENGLLLSNPTNLATGAADTVFVISRYGLDVFQHDEDDVLVAIQNIDKDLSGSVLAWDSSRTRLLVNRCGDWSAFERNGSTFVEIDVDVSDDTANCGIKLLTTSDGMTVYRVGEAGLESFIVESAGDLRYIDTPMVKQEGFHDAVLTGDGLELYTSTRSSDEPTGSILRGYARNAADGALQALEEISLTGSRTLAVANSSRLLFAADATSGVDIYELPSLVYVDTVSYDSVFTEYYRHTPYRLAAGRRLAATTDVIGSSVSLSVVAGTGFTDVLSDVDRFGNAVPRFGTPKDIATSTDGSRIYVSTAEEGILIFERVGAGVDIVDDYIRLGILAVSTGSIEFGETVSDGCIALVDVEHNDAVYTVRNASWQWRTNADWPWSEVADTASTGELCAYTPTEPGQYRLVTEVEVDGVSRRLSSNTLVRDDHGDSFEDASRISAPSITNGWLGPDDTDYFRFELNEPADQITIYSEGWTDTFGLLLDDDGAVIMSDDDGGDGLNFKFTLALDPGTYGVSVSGRGEYTLHMEVKFSAPGPDLLISSAEVIGDPDTGTRGTIEAVVRNDGNRSADATTLRYYRSNDADITRTDEEIGVADVPELSIGASFSHSLDTVIVFDGSYRYGVCIDAVNGERSTSNNCATATMSVQEFELDSMNSQPTAIAYADGHLYITDRSTEVFVYTTSGERRATSEFVMEVTMQGMTYAEGLLYATAYRDPIHRVFAYTTGGEIQEDAGFDLAESNIGPTGIAYAEGLLYVLDYRASETGELFAYTTSGQRRESADFELEEFGDDGIAYADGLLWVSMLHSEWIHAYSLDGMRQPNRDFPRRTENTGIGVGGMTYGEGLFFIVDEDAQKVFIYQGSED